MQNHSNEIGPKYYTKKSPRQMNKKVYFIALIILIAAAFLVNMYLKKNQILYMLNQFPVESKVHIPDVGDFTVKPYITKKITLAEGKHTVTIKVGDQVSEEYEIKIENGILDRVSRKNVFILNIGTGGVILWMSTTYSENPDTDTENPFHIYAGTQFLTLQDIDYFFEEFPETIKIKSGSEVKKTRVDVMRGNPEDIIYSLQTNNIPTIKILNYAEKHLLVNPVNDSLIKEYSIICLGNRLLKRGINFLARNISKRPVLTEWHRYYQILSNEAGKEKTLISEYDTLLEQSPNNSVLLYLRGRLEPDMPGAISFYERSIKADSKNPYPWYAKGYSHAMKGNFAKARAPVLKACELKPGSKDMLKFRWELLFALKEYSELEKEAAEITKRNPFDIDAVDRLMQVYIIQGQIDKAKKLKNRLFTSLKVSMPNDPYNLKTLLGLELSFRLQDMEEYMKTSKSLKDPNQKNFALFRGHLVKLELNEAENVLYKRKDEKTGYNSLLMWLGWKTIAKSDNRARPWMKNAVKIFRNSSYEERPIARLLTAPEKNITEKADNLKLTFSNKAIVYAVLADLYPRKRRELLSRAQKMNFGLHFPHYYLKKVINAGYKRQR